MPSYRRLVLTVLFPLTFAACGSSSSGSGGGAPSPAVATGPIAAADLPNALADAVCAPLAACCGASSMAYADASCRQTTATQVSNDLSWAMMSSTATTYDAKGAGGCVDAVRAYYAQCQHDVKGWDAVVKACARTFPGDHAVGAPCNSTAQCVLGDGNVACMSKGSGQMGGYSPPTCVEVTASTGPAHGKANEACAATCNSQICFALVPPAGVMAGPATCWVADGLQCDMTFTCQPLPATGAACGTGGNCMTDARCVAGTCQPRALASPLGASCSTGDDCASGACDGAICVDPSKLAAPSTCGGQMLPDVFGSRLEPTGSLL
jgi:hypothetical protein